MSSSGHDTTGSKLRHPRLGIIGGSGMCSFRELKIVAETRPETKYGLPSDTISICELGNELVAFLPRHGSKHTIAPHKVPYKARSEEHTSELQSLTNLVCRLLLEKKKN